VDDLLEAWQGHSTGARRAVGAAGGPRTQLATLAVTASLDSFTKVKETMDKMVEDLKKQQEEEVKFKAHCESEFDSTEKETYAKTENKEDLEATIEKLEKLLATVGDEIAAAKADIAATEVAIKQASQAREAENADYQTVVADQRATQEILKKALDKLNTFYKKALLIQSAKQEPPVKFNAYKKNADASPVIGLIEQIVEDSKALEAEAVAGESKAQASYETFVRDSNAVIANLVEEISMKTKAAATAKVDMEQAKSDLGSTEGELESLALYEHDLHSECDFVLKNFNIRQKARLDEIEAIQQAKAYLSGEQ
jgi:chromosome segregation ATPase